jgi:hypothetical protein
LEKFWWILDLGPDEPASIGQLISRLDAIDDDLTVYVRSGDVVSPETPIELIDEEVQSPSDGTSYLLEVGIMKDAIRVWKVWRGGAEPSISQACEAVVYYASYDAFQPV